MVISIGEGNLMKEQKMNEHVFVGMRLNLMTMVVAAMKIVV